MLAVPLVRVRCSASARTARYAFSTSSGEHPPVAVPAVRGLAEALLLDDALASGLDLAADTQEGVNDLGVELFTAALADHRQHGIDGQCLTVAAVMGEGVKEVGHADDPPGKGDVIAAQAPG